MHYVYFLWLSTQKVYTGYTENLERRLSEHERGKVTSTRHHRPVYMIGYESYRLKTDAQRRERYLKTTEGKRLFRQQYRDILQELGG